MNATFGMAIGRYLQDLEIRNYSGRTRQTRAGYLQILTRYLETEGITGPAAVTSQALASFQHWLFHEPTHRGAIRSIPGQNQVLVAVKGLFGFLCREGYLARDPAAGLHYAREPQTLPRNVLTPQEARRIIEAPDTATVLGYRDRTLLEVLYATGIRKAELLALTVDSVNLEEGLLHITHGKGARDRVVPLSAIAVSFLETYIKGIRPGLLRGSSAKALFISQQARPLGRNTLDYLVAKYARLARVKKRVTPHVWRHTCATHLLKNRANLRHVQEILGHKSLVTTERYLRLTITDLKEAHHKFHPRG